VLEQFKDQLVIILLVAAFISFILAYLEHDNNNWSAYVEPLVILLILIANATVGVIQESNAEKAIDALKQYSPDEAKVVRDAHLQKIPATDLVPGDIIHLSVGDKIPADCRVIQISSSSFKVDQSILTGESVSVTKDTQPIKDPKAVKQDQINILFSGTTITIGKAIACVIQTGENTAIGHIHKSIASQVDEKSPLKQALDDFGDQLAKIITVICILVWVINIRHFNDPSFHGNWLKGAVYYFKIAVALAVAAIPEGLAVIITTCLALGTKRMANQGAIVRKLRSVETLGCTTVICSDKTGTLTTNQMSVRRVFTLSTEAQIKGDTYGPEGKVLVDGKLERNLALDPTINELVHICITCSDAKVIYDEVHDQYVNVGEPTEAALCSLAEIIGTDDPQFNKKIPFLTAEELDALSPHDKVWRSGQVADFIDAKYNKLSTFEFSRDRKSMSVLLERKSANTSSPARVTRSSLNLNSTSTTTTSTSRVLYVKGAPESILDRCTSIRIKSKTEPLTQKHREQILKKVYSWGGEEALRVLAFATVDTPTIPPKPTPESYINIEQNMTFVGIVGMMDPPRPEVYESIQKCQKAGIRVIVITGDNKKTAESICRKIGVFAVNEDIEDKSFTGREFDDMSPKQKRHVIHTANLFSRTEPTHKSQLVDLLKQEGFVVAMTGDGVNDAPALKKVHLPNMYGYINIYYYIGRYRNCNGNRNRCRKTCI
jgi:Ca2+ transporting ATPase